MMLGQWIIIACLICCTMVKCNAEETKVQYIRDAKLDDKIDDNNILRVSEFTSETGCARRCRNHDDCVGFYIDSVANRCQEQNGSSNLTDTRTNPGSHFYYKNMTQEVEDPCPIQDGGWSGVSLLPDGLNYKFMISNQVTLNYTGALASCTSYGGSLPSIYTKAKMDFYLANIFTCEDVKGYSYYVDGTNYLASSDYYASDAFRTLAGNVIPQTSDLWASGRPNAPDIQHCIRSGVNYAYMFDDATCEKVNSEMLCEKQV